MSVRSKTVHYLRVAARYLEQPQQLRMRRAYFLPDLYTALSKPWVQDLQIRTIIDIGANVGDFAYTVRPLFPHATIYAFEPLPDSFAVLQKNLVGLTDIVAINAGVGDMNGERSIHKNAFSPSSSFLEMEELHKVAHPSTATIQQDVKVKLVTLDTVDEVRIVEPLMVKIDVQGFEMHVLRGGERTIRRADVVIVETSFQPLYHGGPLFADVFHMMMSWGFRYQGAVDTLEHPGSGVLLQEDSLFVRDLPTQSAA